MFGLRGRFGENRASLAFCSGVPSHPVRSSPTSPPKGEVVDFAALGIGSSILRFLWGRLLENHNWLNSVCFCSE